MLNYFKFMGYFPLTEKGDANVLKIMVYNKHTRYYIYDLHYKNSYN